MTHNSNDNGRVLPIDRHALCEGWKVLPMPKDRLAGNLGMSQGLQYNVRSLLCATLEVYPPRPTAIISVPLVRQAEGI